MEMKNPPHPGKLIGDTLAELGVSISAAAKGSELADSNFIT